MIIKPGYRGYNDGWDALEHEKVELVQFLKIPILEAVEDCQRSFGNGEGELPDTWCTGAEIYSEFVKSYGYIKVPRLDKQYSDNVPPYTPAPGEYYRPRRQSSNASSRAFFWRVMTTLGAHQKTGYLETKYMDPTHYENQKIRMFRLSERGKELLRRG